MKINGIGIGDKVYRIEDNEIKEDVIEEIRIGVNDEIVYVVNIIKDTPMHNMLKKEMVTPMEYDDYIKLVCDQLEILPSEMVIHRLTGDAKREELIAPEWSLKKWHVLNAIDDELKRRNSYQGIKFNKKQNSGILS